jgi:hypothetical protein
MKSKKKFFNLNPEVVLRNNPLRTESESGFGRKPGTFLCLEKYAPS